MQKTLFAAAFALASVVAGAAGAAPAAYRDPLDAATLNTIGSQFSRLMELANRHDIKAIHEMFWQSPTALLVAKSAIPSEGNWAGYWGNDAIDRKLSDIAASGGVVLTPDLARLKVAGRTDKWAESYAPVNITVSYAGQDGTPKPFLLIVEWIKVAKQWKIASEIILPVPPPPASPAK
jgi:predicted RNA-binding protein